MDDYYTRKRKRPKKKVNPFKVVIFLLFCGIIMGAGFFGVKTLYDWASPQMPPKVNTTEENEQFKNIKGSTKDGTEQKYQAKTDKSGSEVKTTTGPHDYSVHIVKSSHQLSLLDRGQVVATWSCAIGKGGLGQKVKSGDNMTPTGTFTVDEIDDASYWTHDFGDGKGDIKHAYGDWFISLDTKQLSKGKWDGIGIHGTHDPNSIGTNASEGCVRLNNENLNKLKKYVKVGTKVTIED